MNRLSLFCSRLLMRTLRSTWAAYWRTHMLQPFHSDTESFIIVLWDSFPNKFWSLLTLWLSNHIALPCLQEAKRDSTKKPVEICDICCLLVLGGIGLQTHCSGNIYADFYSSSYWLSCALQIVNLLPCSNKIICKHLGTLQNSVLNHIDFHPVY